MLHIQLNSAHRRHIGMEPNNENFPRAVYAGYVAWPRSADCSGNENKALSNRHGGICQELLPSSNVSSVMRSANIARYWRSLQQVITGPAFLEFGGLA